jgi:hypothetical protein
MGKEELHVHLVEGKNLIAVDKGGTHTPPLTLQGKSDPYVVLTTAKSKAKSKVTQLRMSAHLFSPSRAI